MLLYMLSIPLLFILRIQIKGKDVRTIILRLDHSSMDNGNKYSERGDARKNLNKFEIVAFIIQKKENH